MSQKYALVTGASSGLGFAMTNDLLDLGYVVFGLSRRGSSIGHGLYIDIPTDIRDEVSVEDAYSLISKTTQGLDLIVNNAGVLEADPIAETSLKDFRNHVDTNLVGPFLVFKHGANFLIENKTHLLTISSLATKKTFSELGAYTASKVALNGLVDVLKKEWSHFNVKFTTLFPGPIDTPLWDGMNMEEHKSEMMSIDGFIKIFEQVISMPSGVEMEEIIFSHK